LIEKALRDEGTSYHYLPLSDFAGLNTRLRDRLRGLLGQQELRVMLGTTWTTDAPFRETPQAISQARRLGTHAVEMEAAALYAFAKARKKSVVCFAMVTNQMGAVEGDFEKGRNQGIEGFLALIRATYEALLPGRKSHE
jgi:uridine phosphorylase